MERKFVLIVSAILIFAVGLGLAQPNLVPATVNKAKEPVPVVIPAHAVEVADNVFSLGTANVDGKTIEGFMIIDYKKDFAKPPGAGTKGGTKCFAFLARGAKWKSAEPWIVNTANSEGLSDSFVFSNLATDIQKWEDAAAKNILGGGNTTTETLAADTSSPDNKNEVYFGDVGSPGAIAVTIVWGIFSGPTFARELVEWDQVYDQVDFDWSSTGEASKMDFENIATHELGHSVGMGHPSDSCTEETMYRFADFGETKKRTLNTGDTAGVKELYK